MNETLQELLAKMGPLPTEGERGPLLVDVLRAEVERLKAENERLNAYRDAERREIESLLRDAMKRCGPAAPPDNLRGSIERVINLLASWNRVKDGKL